MAHNDTFEYVFDKLCAALKKHSQIDSISKEYKNKKSDSERVHFLLALKTVSEVVVVSDKLINNVGQKSCSISDKKREEGNSWFQKKNFNRALRLYTESLAYAPLNDKDTNKSSISLAFANRSAALFHLKEYFPCLRDIELALEHGYADDLHYKLFERQARCWLALEKYENAERSFKDALGSLSDAKLDPDKQQQWESTIQKGLKLCKKERTDNGCKDNENNIITKTSEDVSKLQINDTMNMDELIKLNTRRSSIAFPVDRELPCMDHTNHTFPSLCSSAKVVYTEEKGRHIVAARDINPGEVILIEEPYSAILLPEQWYDHCNSCFQPCLAPLPCDNCTTGMFCSTSCKKSAANSQTLNDCRGGVYELLRVAGVDKFAFLALSAVMQMSAAKHWKSRNSEGTMYDSDYLMKGCSADGKYHYNDHSSILSLVTNDHQRSAHDLFRRGVIAVYLLRVLQTTGYLSRDLLKLSDEQMRDLEAYIGGLLLSYLQSFPCNAHEIPEFILNPSNIATSSPQELGAGIYATLSLFNHSCDPAVTRNFYGRVCVVRTIRYVRAGEELADNYGALYALEGRDNRRSRLMKQYLFTCGCQACVEDWGLFSCDTLTGPPRWRCTCNENLNNTVNPLINNKDISENLVQNGKAEPDVVRDNIESKSLGKPAGVDDSIKSVINRPTNNCECVKNTTEKLEMLKKSYTRYKIAFDHLLAGNVAEALPVFLEHLALMDRLVYRPWAEFCGCQEAIKQCYSLMGNCRTISDTASLQ